MIRRLRKLKAILLERFPQTRLEPLNGKRIARLQKRFPKLPAHLASFFGEVGCGRVGDSQYMIYDLLSPEGIFDDETAAGLEGIFSGWRRFCGLP
jgi:hypothetical protein